MFRELKFVVAFEFISIPCVFVLFVAIKAIPVVVLNGCSAFVDEITRPLKS
jgi:hypothetical protein